MSIQRKIVDFLKSSKEVVFFRNPYTEMKAAAFLGGGIFFDEADDDVVIVVNYEQIRVLFFVDTDEGGELKSILRSKEFDNDESAFEANRLSHQRLGKMFDDEHCSKL